RTSRRTHVELIRGWPAAEAPTSATSAERVQISGSVVGSPKTADVRSKGGVSESRVGSNRRPPYRCSGCSVSGSRPRGMQRASRRHKGVTGVLGGPPYNRWDRPSTSVKEVDDVAQREATAEQRTPTAEVLRLWPPPSAVRW